MAAPQQLTSASGIPIADNQNSITAGATGPTLLQDFHLIEKLQHFHRERCVVYRRPAPAPFNPLSSVFLNAFSMPWARVRTALSR